MTTAQARPITETSNQIEGDLFQRILNSALKREGDYHQDVQTVRELYRFLVDGKDVPILRAEKLSAIAGRPVNILLASNIQPGGSAKGLGIFGIIFQNLRDHLKANPQAVNEIAASANPIRELIVRTFDNSVIVSNSAGNFAAAVAETFGKLAKEYNLNIDTTGFLALGAPAFKQNRIVETAPDSDDIKPLQFYDPKDPDKRKSDRNQVLKDYAEFERGRGRKVFEYPTEPSQVPDSAQVVLTPQPNAPVYGALYGFAILQQQIAQYSTKHGISNETTYYPSSSAPTAGAAVKYNRDLRSVVFVQDRRNGHFIEQILEKARAGEITITGEQSAALVEKFQQIKRNGSAANGLSTPHITAETLAQITDARGNLLLTPDDIRNNIKLVSPAGLKLAAGLTYLETRSNSDIGAVLPEPAGSAAIAAILEDAAAKLGADFSRKVAEAIGNEDDYEVFKKVSGLTQAELEELNLGNLQTDITARKGKWTSNVTRNVLTFGNRSEQTPIIAVLSGANTQQPLEVAVSEFIRAGQLIDPTDLLEKFAEANPNTIHELLSRKTRREIDGVTFYSGNDFAQAIHNALELKSVNREIGKLNPIAISKSDEGGYGHYTLLLEKKRNPAAAISEELLALVKNTVPDINNIRDWIGGLQTQLHRLTTDYRPFTAAI